VKTAPGKSTLVRIVSGVVPRDGGTIVLDGREVQFGSPREAIENGISIIHQELSMLPHLNVIENIYTGRMESRAGVVDWDALAQKTRAALGTVEMDIDPFAIVGNLSISERQMVEIAKAVDKQCRILIMDEPNSSLSEHESEILFRIIKKLRGEGMAIVYISHKLEEVLLISDRITPLRDGGYVGTVPAAGTDVDSLVTMMVGRNLVRGQARNYVGTETVLEARADGKGI
jgi:ribose transport system ATP-binding protein